MLAKPVISDSTTSSRQLGAEHEGVRFDFGRGTEELRSDINPEAQFRIENLEGTYPTRQKNRVFRRAKMGVGSTHWLMVGRFNLEHRVVEIIRNFGPWQTVNKYSISV